MLSPPNTRFLPQPRELPFLVVLGVLLGLILTTSGPKPATRNIALLFAPMSPAPACTSPAGYLPDTTSKALSACYLFHGLSWYPDTEVMPKSVRGAITPPPPPRRPPFYTKYVPLAEGQSPNSIRLHSSQAPLPVSAKNVNGRYVCAKKSDDPGKSQKNRRAHIDRQCCLDPDEVPNPHCDYSSRF